MKIYPRGFSREHAGRSNIWPSTDEVKRVLDLGIRFDRTGDYIKTIQKYDMRVMVEKGTVPEKIRTVENEVSQLKPDSVTTPKDLKIFVDSGAPSLYNKHMRSHKGGAHTYMGSFLGDRKNDDYSYLKSDHYIKYRRQYVLFIKKYLPYIEVYANLDVINNAEETWYNQQYMESKGLKPIPVWHFGNSPEWLKMYLDRGHDYIAIGGIIPNPENVIYQGLDKIWSEMLTDDMGMPKVKVHGFAVTSAGLLTRYPWYSVDSTSWVKFGKYGIVCVPKTRGGKFDYARNAHNVTVSDRSPQKKEIEGKHILTYSKAERLYILDYFNKKGYKLGKSEYKVVPGDYTLGENERWIKGKKGDKSREIEIVIEKGLANSYKLRDELNIMYYIDLQNSVPKWPWAFKQHKQEKFDLFK